MYFNFEENHPDTPRLASSLSVLERVLLTTVSYLLVIILMLVLPKTEWYKAQLLAKEQERAQVLEEQLQQQRDDARFVFMAPKVDIRAPEPPKRAELSDIDRQASAPERALKAENPLPFSRGNSPERIDEVAGPRERPEPASPPPAAGEPEPSRAVPLPESPTAANVRPNEGKEKPRGFATGVLSEAIRNVEKYAGGEKFNNLQGGAPDKNYPSIHFDAKGADFGPWLRRFVAQIRRNWFIPYAAMSEKGHVVVTFNVHRDGRITDLQVMKPAMVQAFTHSAHNAIAASNPTLALPPDYPDTKAFFTVTFFFNETPDR